MGGIFENFFVTKKMLFGTRNKVSGMDCFAFFSHQVVKLVLLANSIECQVIFCFPHLEVYCFLEGKRL